MNFFTNHALKRDDKGKWYSSPMIITINLYILQSIIFIIIIPTISSPFSHREIQLILPLSYSCRIAFYFPFLFCFVHALHLSFTFSSRKRKIIISSNSYIIFFNKFLHIIKKYYKKWCYYY